MAPAAWSTGNDVVQRSLSLTTAVVTTLILTNLHTAKESFTFNERKKIDQEFWINVSILATAHLPLP